MRYTPWTPAEDETLRALYEQGRSFTEIARAVNRTKNSTISRSRRLKLPSRGVEHTRRMASRSAKLRKAKTPLRPVSKPKERKAPMFLRVVSVPASKPVGLIERTGCCYPTTAEGPHLFCNEPTNGSDYCEFHHRVIYPRRRAA